MNVVLGWTRQISERQVESGDEVVCTAGVFGSSFGREVCSSELKISPHAAEDGRVAESGFRVGNPGGVATGFSRRHPAFDFGMVEVEEGLDD